MGSLRLLDMTSIYSTPNTGTTLRSTDDDSPPPFRILDQLAAARLAVDEKVSLLIGRLAPYRDDGPVPDPGPAEAQNVRVQAPSSLERRIEGETDQLMEISDNLRRLLDDLRL